MESEPSGQATYLPPIFEILQMCFSFYCSVLQLKNHKRFTHEGLYKVIRFTLSYKWD